MVCESRLLSGGEPLVVGAAPELLSMYRPANETATNITERTPEKLPNKPRIIFSRWLRSTS